MSGSENNIKFDDIRQRFEAFKNKEQKTLPPPKPHRKIVLLRQQSMRDVSHLTHRYGRIIRNIREVVTQSESSYSSGSSEVSLESFQRTSNMTIDDDLLKYVHYELLSNLHLMRFCF